MKKEIIIGICFCMAGILCAAFFGYEYFTTYGFLNEYHMKSFAGTEWDSSSLLANILWERGKFFSLVWILSYTPVKKILPLILRCGLFFTMGVFLAACVLNMGPAGFAFFFASWIPQGFLYLAALLLLLHMEPGHFYHQKNVKLKKAAYVSAVLVLILFGCVLEAVIGTKLLGFVIGRIYG